MIAVLGPGGVGGLVAAALARAGEDVTVVARPDTARRIGADGIRVRSVALGDFMARPGAVTTLTEPTEALVVATKATTLPGALERVDTTPDIVVPLLNGIEHLGLLRERFGADRVPAAVIRVESDRPEPGLVVQGSPTVRIDIAPDRAGVGDLATRFGRAGIAVRLDDDEPTVMWRKLARLCSLALVTTAYQVPMGAIKSTPELWDELASCVREVVAVAQLEGASLAAPEVLAEHRCAHGDLTSSMRRDVAAGRAPELDAIAGAVLRAASRHDLACPTVDRLAGRIRGTLDAR